jgi:hypothetical protein
MSDDYWERFEVERLELMRSWQLPNGSSYSYPARDRKRRINIVARGTHWKWVVGDQSLITCSITPEVGANGWIGGRGRSLTLGAAARAAEKCASKVEPKE